MPEKKMAATEAPAAESVEAAARLDQVIARVETFYQSLTGRTPPPLTDEPYAPIPVEQDPAQVVGEQLERLLRSLEQPTAAPPTWSPPLSVWEGDREMVVCLDLAGVRREDLELAVEGSSLVVRGRRPAANDGLSLRLSERPLGAFERRVVLPQRVTPVEPDAVFKNGMLEIRLAKEQAESAGRRQIKVG